MQSFTREKFFHRFVLVAFLLTLVAPIASSAQVRVFLYATSEGGSFLESQTQLGHLALGLGGQVLLQNSKTQYMVVVVPEEFFGVLRSSSAYEALEINSFQCWKTDCLARSVPLQLSITEAGLSDFKSYVDSLGATLQNEGSPSNGTVNIRYAVAQEHLDQVVARDEVLGAELPFSGPGIPPPTPDPLWLGQGQRFFAQARWETLEASGFGTPLELKTDTGSFWFFRPDNLELTIKVLNGCAFNGHYWIYLSGLTDLGVEVNVKDIETGATALYESALDTPFELVRDTRGLPCE